jgi:hypothetical protein
MGPSWPWGVIYFSSSNLDPSSALSLSLLSIARGLPSVNPSELSKGKATRGFADGMVVPDLFFSQ